MDDSKLIAAIDVGTTKVFALVAELDEAAKPRVLAHSTVPCRGLAKGNVEDFHETSSSIKAAINNVETEAGVRVKSAYVGVTGAHVSYENRRDRLESAGSLGVITPADLVEDARLKRKSDSDRQIVHAMPISYTLDGESGIQNPLGMHSRSVEVDTHVITADRDRLRILTKASEKAGIEVDALVMEPLASGLSTLTLTERGHGTLLIDVGGGTSDIVLFRGDKVCYTAVVPVAGYQFTNDICVTYNVDYQIAEDAKLAYGHTEPTAVDSSETINLSLKDGSAEIAVPARDLAQLLRERAVELAQLIQMKLAEVEPEQIGHAKVVLTGGASRLPGLADILQRYLGRRVRLGFPSDVEIASGQVLTDPMHATGLGLITWAASQPKTTSQAIRIKKNTLGADRFVGIGVGMSRQIIRAILSPWEGAAVGGRQA